MIPRSPAARGGPGADGSSGEADTDMPDAPQAARDLAATTPAARHPPGSPPAARHRPGAFPFGPATDPEEARHYGGLQPFGPPLPVPTPPASALPPATTSTAQETLLRHRLEGLLQRDQNRPKRYHTPPPQAPRLPPACYRCGQPGHKMATCPQNASKPAQQRSPRTTTHTPTTSAQPAHHAATTTRSPTPARSHPPPFVTSNRLQSLTPQPHPPQPPRPAARHLPAPRLDPRLAARHHQAQALRLHAAYLGAAMAGILDAEDADSPPRKRPTGPRQYWAYNKSVAIIPTSHPHNVPWLCPFPVCPLAISHQSADRDKRKLLLCCGDVEENPGPAKHSPSVPQHGLSTLWNQRTGNPPIACDPSGMQATDFPVTNVETGHPSPSPKRPRTDTEGDSLMAETPGALSSMMPDSVPQPGQSGCPDKVSCAGLPDGNGNLVADPPHCPIPPTPTQ